MTFNKNIIIGIIAVIIVLIGGIFFWQMQGATSSTSGSQTGSNQNPPPATATYTAAQVATHNNASSCWSIIDAKVYDLTAWIPQHPGGQQAILGLCGKDGTAAFHGQHDDAQRQADILATMQIGTLAQ